MGSTVLFDAPQAVDFTTARSADGRALVEWLTALGVIGPDPFKPGTLMLRRNVRGNETGRWTRAIYAWAYEGRCSDFYVVDELCTALGIHVSEAPANIWRAVPAKVRLQVAA